MTALNLVYDAIDIVNEQIVSGTKIGKTENTVLLGEEGTIDSLSLVNLVVAVEEIVLDRLGKAITLVDEETFTDESRPLATVGSLASLVDKKLAE
jgi:acyl carrier protein